MRLPADLNLQVAGEPSLQQMVAGGGAAFLLDEAGAAWWSCPRLRRKRKGAGRRPQRPELSSRLGSGRAGGVTPPVLLWWQADGERGLWRAARG